MRSFSLCTTICTIAVEDIENDGWLKTFVRTSLVCSRASTWVSFFCCKMASETQVAMRERVSEFESVVNVCLIRLVTKYVQGDKRHPKIPETSTEGLDVASKMILNNDDTTVYKETPRNTRCISNTMQIVNLLYQTHVVDTYY